MMLSRAQFVAGAATGIIAGCRLPARAQALTPVRVGMAVTEAVTPVLYGIQSGLFRDAGLDVQIVTGNNGASMAAAVAGGALELGVSSLISLVTAHVRGVNLPIIAGSTLFVSEAPTSEVCVLKPAPVKSFADLNGSTITLQTLRSLDELGIRAAVDKAGGNSAGLKFIEVPAPLMLEALRKDRAGALSTSEPNLAKDLGTGELRILGATYGAIASRLLIAAFFCSPAFLAQNRGVLDRFTSVLYRATQYANTHHTETAPLLAAFAKMDPALIARMTRATNATSLDVRDIQPVIDVAAGYKFIEHGFAAKELLG